MTKGEISMPAIQHVAALGFSLLLLAVSPHAHAQQKMEFKFNLKDIFKTDNTGGQPAAKPAGETPVTQKPSPPAGDSHPVVPETPQAIQRRPDAESANHAADGSDATRKDYWEARFRACSKELRAMEGSSQPFPSNDCATALNAEFMQAFIEAGFANSKIACINEISPGYISTSVNYNTTLRILRTGVDKPTPPKSRHAGIYQRQVSLYNRDIAFYRCNQQWPYASLYSVWNDMLNTRGSVRITMNSANEKLALEQEFERLTSEQKTALVQWQRKSLRPGPASLCDKNRCDRYVDVIQLKGDKVLIEIEECASTGEATKRTEYYSKSDGSYVGFKDESVEECTSYSKYRESVDRSSIRPSGWIYDNSHHTIPCNDQWKNRDENIKCWISIRERNMKKLN